ncbi:hypothetical protein KI387_004610, partial [Taxus chinensis]
MRELSDKEKRDRENQCGLRFRRKNGKLDLKRVVNMAERGEASSRQGREGRQVPSQAAAAQE